MPAVFTFAAEIPAKIMTLPDHIRLKLLPFADLTPGELYNILRLRSEIFVVEQNCVFLEQDNKDQGSWHLMLMDGDRLAAYVRLLPPELSYEEMSIGRVVTASFARGTGLGVVLMKQAIESCIKLFGNGPIRIGAQYHLKKFYESVGFQIAGEIYDEDGIDHAEMLRPADEPQA